ncbi:MAG: shikimate kinase [Acholeplasmatales bacterium]|nr:shikimate kinase [Acholeplasmatales bacterium]
MRLYLIGMPGCGKSTLGKRLAKEINYEFIDMDIYIEKQAGMFIDEIFEAYGEDFFRALETNVLKEFLQMDNVIIATGGGVIKNKSNKKLMDGKCIFLNVPTDVLQVRLDESTIVRPLLKTKTVDELYNERKDLYDYFSDISVDNIDVAKAIDTIKEKLL